MALSAISGHLATLGPDVSAASMYACAIVESGISKVAAMTLQIVMEAGGAASNGRLADIARLTVLQAEPVQLQAALSAQQKEMNTRQTQLVL